MNREFTRLRPEPRARPRLRTFRPLMPAPFARLRGFILLETVVALAMFGILLLLAMPFLFSFHSNALFNDAVEQVVQDLRRAQSLAIAGAGDSSQGVYFDTAGERWVLFGGTTYLEGAAANEVHVLPTVVDLVSVSLSGGGSSIIFTERIGRTTNVGSVVLRSGSRQVTVAVNAAGGVSRQ